MKAVVFEEKGKLVLTERPKPCLEKDTDVLVKVTLTHHLFQRYPYQTWSSAKCCAGNYPGP